MGEAIRVVVVDDHHVVRQGLRAFLDIQADIDVVGDAADGDAAIELAESLQPDVMLLDLKLPTIDGVDVVKALHERQHTVRVLVLTSFTDPSTVVPALRVGAVGYLFKDVDPEALASAIRTVHAGQVLLEPDVAAALLSGGPANPRAETLTDREREVLAQLAHGRSNREIARALVLSEKTVKTHVSSILSKLDLADRTQAALYAVRQGMV